MKAVNAFTEMIELMSRRYDYTTTALTRAVNRGNEGPYSMMAGPRSRRSELCTIATMRPTKPPGPVTTFVQSTNAELVHDIFHAVTDVSRAVTVGVKVEPGQLKAIVSPASRLCFALTRT
jgi:hypothetical protein